MSAMTPSYRPWLPAGAVQRGARDVPFARAVAEWSAKWFPADRAVVATDADVLDPAEGPDHAAGACWLLDEGPVLVLAADVDIALAGLLFGERDEGIVPTAADRAAIDGVIVACLADLRARIAAALRLPAEAPWRPTLDTGGRRDRWAWHARTAGGAMLFSMLLDDAFIVTRLRSALPPRPLPPPLAPLGAALADREVGISALVGRCRLTTAELAGLASGDVVVLDRTFADPATLAVDGTIQRRSCTVTDDNGRLVLTLSD